MSTACDQLLLSLCFQYHPDVAVRKEIDRLMVKCANHELGCSWEGTVKEHEVLGNRVPPLYQLK